MMKLRIEKSEWGDFSLLGVLALLLVVSVLLLVGGTTWSGRGGNLRVWVTLAVFAGVSIPVWFRLMTSAPLVELDAENVSFFVGKQRDERCRIPRSALLQVSVQTERDEPVLSLLFDAGALRDLRQYAWTPYLKIKSEEVLIAPVHVRGNMEKIADTWNEALRRTSAPAK